MRLLSLVFALAAALGAMPLHAARYTYHGELMDAGKPASGTYELRVTAYGKAGSTIPLAAPVELSNVKPVDGSFAVELDVPDSATGTTWVQVALRQAGSGAPYEALGSPQPIANVNSGCPFSWSTDGNTGLAAGSFLGIADPASAAPLVLKARNAGVATFTPRGATADYGDAPGVALGSSANKALGYGATVAGGGSTRDGSGTTCAGCANTASGGFAVVSGGLSNTASDYYSTVAGGTGNTASGYLSTVLGGADNNAPGQAAAAAGSANCAGGAGSMALGKNAIVRHGTGAAVACPGTSASGDANGDEGSFVWGDSQFTPTVTTGPDQFLVRAQGGMALNGAPAFDDAELTVNGVADDHGGGYVELELRPTPSLNGNTGEGIELGVGVGGMGSNDADFRIGQRNNSAFTPVFMIDSGGITYVKNGTVGTISDARLKKNIGDIAHPLDTLLGLHGHVFEYRDPVQALSDPRPRMGFLAQEVQGALPNWVHPTGDGWLTVAPIGFEALTVEAIRDLRGEKDRDMAEALAAIENLNARLENENAALRDALRQLSSRVQRLEANKER